MAEYQAMQPTIRSIVNNILTSYIAAKQDTFAGHPMGTYFRNEIPSAFYASGLVNEKTHLVTGSVGQGNWATVPWVCIFDRNITTSATKGVYIVYLLAKDGKTLYLTFNQGCTEISKNHSKRETIQIMRDKATEIINRIDGRGFRTDEGIDLGNGLTTLAKFYQKGTIFYKAYRQGKVPSEDELRQDLSNMMAIYAAYAGKASSHSDEWWPSLDEYNPGISKQQWLELLGNPGVFTPDRLTMMAQFYALGGQASCALMADTYGKTSDFYRMACGVHLAERIINEVGCPICDQKNAKCWPVLFVGRDAKPEERGTYIWKLRDELMAALKEFGIEKYLAVSDASKIGRFDSWEIIDNTTAVKHCDKSFFEHNGSGVPKGICWFFGADNMDSGETKQITLLYQGKQYQGRIANESSDRRRVRLFWTTELGKAFATYNAPDTTATFKRTADNTYEVVLKGGEKEMTIKEKVAAIKSYIAAKGFNYEGDLIENFYLSLKSKPFVILAGTSGTGKTRLVKLFAEAIGAKMKLVPVRPDWSDSSDLFGHTDLSNRFHPGAIIDFVKQAEWNKEVPHFLCLDEMNLARVEYYLSDFLSIIETRDRKDDGTIETDPLVDVSYYKDKEARDKYGRVYIPENLYIIGTVNMDETTFPFSKKVLDRANTIEFSFVNLMSKAAAGGSPVAQKLDNGFLKTEYLYLRDCCDTELIDTVCFNLEELNQILVKANLHVGYRVRDEISFYMMNNKASDLLSADAAFDHEIMQKILPRIQGSSAAIKEVLSELFMKCAGDYSGFSGTTAYEQMQSYLDSKSCKHPNSAKKIAFMMRRYEEDGFTSYWL